MYFYDAIQWYFKTKYFLIYIVQRQFLLSYQISELKKRQIATKR